jgi:hypothetical protein
MIAWLKDNSEVKNFIKGPLFRVKVPLSIDRDKRTLVSLTLFSNGKKGTILRYLIGKLLWDELNLVEKELLWQFPDSTKFPIYQILLSIKIVGKRTTRENYNKVAPFFQQRPITRENYLSMKHQIVCLIRKDEKRLPKGPKFSGYCKGHRDHGSIGTEREYYSQEYTDTVCDREEIFLSFLTIKDYRQGYILLMKA